jgi:hypothetical protein
MDPLPRAPHCILHPFPRSPPSIRGVKHPFNQAISSPIYHRAFLRLNHRPPPPPRPLYKGRALPSSTAPLPALLHFSLGPSTAHTECLLRRFFTTIGRPPQCRLRPSEARDGLPVHPLPVHPSPVAPPLAGHHALEWPLGRAPSSSVASHCG